jgi:hypothetical protein
MGLDRRAGRIALVSGAIGLISVGSLAAFFAVGGPFGAINDWTIGAFGLLTGLLAVGQRRRDGTTKLSGGVMPLALALIGAGIVVFGSYLVITDTTGFLLAGLVESLGFALIGVWLIVINRSMAGTSQRPRRLPGLGIVAGIVMAIGFIVVPGIAESLDDASAAPPWVWLGFLGWIGTFFLYPIWSIWFGLAADSQDVPRTVRDDSIP